MNIKFIIIPLVDKGSIENLHQEKNLILICKQYEKYLIKNNVNIIFESDYKAKRLVKLIKKLNLKYFGINYDVGNSASLNYNINDEFLSYGKFKECSY